MKTEIPTHTKAESSPGAKAPLWTASFILICLSTMTTFIAFHSLIPTLPIYIQQYGGSKGIAGLALGSLTLAAVLIRPVTGWALDSYGRRLIYLSGLFIFLLVTVVYTWMIPVAALVFFRFVQGIGWGILNTASPTIASDVVPASRIGEGMGFFSLTSSISLAIAPGIGLWIVDSFSFPVLFIACSVLTLAALLLALPIKYPPVEKQAQHLRFVIMEKSALRPAMVILFTTFTYSSFMSFLALFVREQGMTSAGIFFLTLALTTLITRPLSGLIVDRRGRSGYDLTMIIGSLAALIAMPILAQTTTATYLVASGIFYGIGFGFIQPTMLALCISKVPAAKRGGANATYWTAFDIGVAAGSIIWGLVADAYGYSAMFNLTVIPIIVAALIYFVRPKNPPLETSTPASP
ncbi:MAG: MFS transporter [Bacillota bacterium]